MPGKGFDLPLLCNKIALYTFELVPQETLHTLKLELLSYTEMSGDKCTEEISKIGML